MKADSMQAAAARLGVPVSKLLKAKRLGCPAFVSGRVDIEALRQWLADRKKNQPKPEAIPPAGVEEELRRLEEMERTLFARYQSGDDSIVREYLDAAALLPKTRLAALRHAEKMDQLIPVAQANAFVANVLNPIRDRVAHLPALATRCNNDAPNIARAVLDEAAREIIDLMIAATQKATQ